MIIDYHVAMARRLNYDKAIFDLLVQAPGPMSADEIRGALSATGIGIATVYRLLKRGEIDGQLAAVEMPTGPTRYEPADRPHHHHFECDDCHRVYDVMGCPGSLDKLVPGGFQVQSHDLLLHGLCPSCSEANAR